MIEFISQLPTEYQEVEYIESSGTQYIDTGYKPTSNNLRIACEFEYTADHSASSVFGSESSGQYSIVPWGAPEFYVGSSTQLLAQTTALNTKYALDAHANAGTLTVSLNGTTNSASYSGSILTTVNMGIFCNNVAGVASQFCSMKLYAMYIYDNGNLVRDFVPCYRKADNVAGLYDLVNNVFYTNAGSGVFTVGANSNKHATATIIPGGVISFGAALRRRMMSKKPAPQWTLTVVSTVANFATVSINGESLTAGSYVVDDGTIASFVATGGLSNSIYLDGVKLDTSRYDLVMHANYTATAEYTGYAVKWEITTQGGGAPISELPLGALINIGTDGGADTPNYEIADKDNLVPGGVVLVRKNIYSKSKFGSNTFYPNSTLDNLITTTIYNRMPQKLRDKMMDVSFTIYNPRDITRKMFALTYTMAGFGDYYGVAEGKALQLYTSNASRVKTYNGSAVSWWLSSQMTSNDAWFVYLDGSAGGTDYTSTTYGVVPAFAISSETLYDATPNTDGSYNLIL